MSKNIVIQEGGVGRQFTASKLKTALVGGGSCDWVPEDEIQLGIKNITENGTYMAADDGEYGYSQVTVNVSSAEKIITGTTDSGEPVVTTIDVVDGTISEIILGDYFIVTYDGDGNVAKIEDNNGNRCLLTYDGETLSGFDDIEDNNYTIILDSNGNISQVIDPNAQDCELRDSDSDGKIDIISIGTVLCVIPDIETGDIKIIDENDNDVTDDYIGTSITGVDSNDTPWRANIVSDSPNSDVSVGITPVNPATTPGASIKGVDVDGDDAVVSIDNSRNITTKKLPSNIRITTPPTKIVYIDKEQIDLAGIVVKAYLNSGEIWTDNSHPDGIIPKSELTLPVKVADSSILDEDPRGATSPYETALEQPIPYGTDGYTLVLKDGRRFVYTTTGEDTVKIFRLIRSNGATAPTLMSSSDFVVTEMEYRPNGYPGSVETHTPNRSTIRGRPVYICYLQGSAVISYSSTTTVDIYTNATPTDDDYYTVVYGTEVGGGYSVPVEWLSEYDGEKVYSDTFTITINQATESDNSGGGTTEGGNTGSGTESGGETSPVSEGITVQDINIAIYNAMNAGQDHIEIDGQQYTLAEAQAMIDYLISH